MQINLLLNAILLPLRFFYGILVVHVTVKLAELYKGSTAKKSSVEQRSHYLTEQRSHYLTEQRSGYPTERHRHILSNLAPILIFGHLLVSSAVYADVIPESATSVCSRLTSDAQTSCNKIIHGGTFNPEASGACDQATNTDVILACLSAIKNNKYNATAVDACARIPDADSTTDCLKTIANKNYTSAEITKCDGKSDGPKTVSCFSRRGKAMIAAPQTPKIKYVFTADGSACQELTSENALIATPTLQTCIDKTPGIAPFWITGGARTCGYVVPSSLIVVPAPLPSACAKTDDEFDSTTKKYKYAGVLTWVGEQGNKCVTAKHDAATGKTTILHAVDRANCLIPRLSFFQWFSPSGLTGKSQVCLAYSACGARLGTVANSFCDGKPNHFVKSQSNLGFTWQSCKKSGTGTTVPFDSNNKFVASCAPDTLYAWHPAERVALALANESVDQLLKMQNTSKRYFLWRTPIGSFGYGKRAVRLKLKPGVKFVLTDFGNRDCDTLATEGDVNKTVFVSTDSTVGNGNYSEYILCSTTPVESWSTDMGYSTDEMQREYKWITKQGANGTIHFDSLFGTDVTSKIPWNMDQNWDNADSGTDWSEDALKKNLANAAKNADQGEVFFDRHAVPSLWNHFSTNRPGYFNPFDATADDSQRDTWPERDQTSCLAD